MIINETITTIVVAAVIGLIFAYLRAMDEKISIIKETVHPDFIRTSDRLEKMLDEIKGLLIKIETVLSMSNKGNPPK